MSLADFRRVVYSHDADIQAKVTEFYKTRTEHVTEFFKVFNKTKDDTLGLDEWMTFYMDKFDNRAVAELNIQMDAMMADEKSEEEKEKDRLEKVRLEEEAKLAEEEFKKDNE